MQELAASRDADAGEVATDAAEIPADDVVDGVTDDESSEERAADDVVDAGDAVELDAVPESEGDTEAGEVDMDAADAAAEHGAADADTGDLDAIDADEAGGDVAAEGGVESEGAESVASIEDEDVEAAPAEAGAEATAQDGEAAPVPGELGPDLLAEFEAPRPAAPPGVQLSEEIPIDPEDDLRAVEGEASLRLVSILESLLFAAAKPLKVQDLRKVLAETSKHQIQLALKHLMAATAERGVVLAQVAGGFQFRTHPENAVWVQKMLQSKPARLSRTQIETLAIVAYRQPITRPEIDDVRGVDSGAVLKTLLEREMIQIVGKKEEPGRPLLYGTTVRFLEFFNLRSLRDMPTLRDFRDLSEESKATLRARLGESEAEALGQGVLGLDLSAGPKDRAQGTDEDGEEAGAEEAPEAEEGAELDEGVSEAEGASGDDIAGASAVAEASGDDAPVEATEATDDLPGAIEGTEAVDEASVEVAVAVDTTEVPPSVETADHVVAEAPVETGFAEAMVSDAVVAEEADETASGEAVTDATATDATDPGEAATDATATDATDPGETVTDATVTDATDPLETVTDLTATEATDPDATVTAETVTDATVTDATDPLETVTEVTATDATDPGETETGATGFVEAMATDRDVAEEPVDESADETESAGETAAAHDDIADALEAGEGAAGEETEAAEGEEAEAAEDDEAVAASDQEVAPPALAGEEAGPDREIDDDAGRVDDALAATGEPPTRTAGVSPDEADTAADDREPSDDER